MAFSQSPERLAQTTERLDDFEVEKKPDDEENPHRGGKPERAHSSSTALKR